MYVCMYVCMYVYIYIYIYSMPLRIPPKARCMPSGESLAPLALGSLAFAVSALRRRTFGFGCSFNRLVNHPWRHRHFPLLFRMRGESRTTGDRAPERHHAIHHHVSEPFPSFLGRRPRHLCRLLRRLHPEQLALMSDRGRDVTQELIPLARLHVDLLVRGVLLCMFVHVYI